MTLFYMFGEENNAAGSNDLKNDCLNLLQKQLIIMKYQKVLNLHINLKGNYNKKKMIKKPISKLIYLEDRFKINLNVTGDKTFISTNKYKKLLIENQ